MAIRSFNTPSAANTLANLSKTNYYDFSKQAELFNKGMQQFGELPSDMRMREALANGDDVGTIASLMGTAGDKYSEGGKQAIGSLMQDERLANAIEQQRMRDAQSDYDRLHQQGLADQRQVFEVEQQKQKLANDLLVEDTRNKEELRRLGVENKFKAEQDEKQRRAEEKKWIANAEIQRTRNKLDADRLEYDKEKAKAEALVKKDKPNIIDQGLQKSASERLVELSRMSDKEIGKRLEQDLADDNLIEDVALSSATKKKFIDMQKAFLADSTISADDKQAFLLMNTRQKADALAKMQGLKFVDQNWARRNLLPRWLGGSDMLFVDQNK